MRLLKKHIAPGDRFLIIADNTISQAQIQREIDKKEILFPDADIKAGSVFFIANSPDSKLLFLFFKSQDMLFVKKAKRSVFGKIVVAKHPPIGLSSIIFDDSHLFIGEGGLRIEDPNMILLIRKHHIQNIVFNKKENSISFILGGNSVIKEQEVKFSSELLFQFYMRLLANIYLNA